MKPSTRRDDKPSKQYLHSSGHKRRLPLWYVLGLIVGTVIIVLYTGLVIYVAVMSGPKAAIDIIWPLVLLIVTAIVSRLRRPNDNDGA